VHVLGIQAAVEQLGVSATAVDVLLVLNSKLDDDWLILITEGLELSRRGIELGVLACLDTLALLSISVKLSGGQDKFASIGTFVG